MEARMVFGWLNRKFEKSQRDEVERFLVSTRGADTEVVDMIHGYTMFWAAFYSDLSIDLYNLEDYLPNNLLFPAQLVKHIKLQQSENNQPSATGLMVWLYSARALMYPELRLSGRQLWGELSRSTFRADQFVEHLAERTGLLAYRFDRLRVPEGLQADGY
jgi:hypothetical protein